MNDDTAVTAVVWFRICVTSETNETPWTLGFIVARPCTSSYQYKVETFIVHHRFSRSLKYNHLRKPTAQSPDEYSIYCIKNQCQYMRYLSLGLLTVVDR